MPVYFPRAKTAFFIAEQHMGYGIALTSNISVVRFTIYLLAKWRVIGGEWREEQSLILQILIQTGG